MSKEFPSKYFSTMLACVSGTVQAMVIGGILNRNPLAWALKWDLQLLTVVYSVSNKPVAITCNHYQAHPDFTCTRVTQGVFNTGITFCLISWAVARRGPTYPSMFNSLALIVTTVLDSVLLGTDVSVGR